MKIIFLLVLIIAISGLTKSYARAQQPQKVHRIGWITLYGSKPGRTFASFRAELSERGHIEGQNLTILFRSGLGREDRLAEVAAELVRSKVDVIVADSNAATRIAKKATTTIPIVFVHGDPIWVGVANNLAQPGSNLTGISILSFELAGKRLELLRDAFSKISRVAVLLDADAPVHKRQLSDMEKVAQLAGIQIQALELRNSKVDVESIFQRAVSQRADALMTLLNPTISFHATRIVDLAAKSRLPAMYPASMFTDAGGLMSYGPNYSDLFRRAAYYVDRILKGAKPSDLPVEQPTKFELVINLKTAKQIGLTIPPKVLMWADRVTE